MGATMDPDSTRYTLEKHIEGEAQLFKGLDGQVYARYRSVEGIEIVPVDTRQFEDWLIQQRCCSRHMGAVRR